MHGKAMGLSSNSMSLNFASPMFDVSLTEILTTLLYAGCVCVPSDDDRKTKLAKAIKELGVNWALLTPSFVKTISPSKVPSLKTLVLAGEPMTAKHIRDWGSKVRLINGYGPTECCIFSVINNWNLNECDQTNIGRAVGGISWITVPSDINHLAPIGSIGELIIEGPILARGYLDDKSKTDDAFITRSAWSENLDLNSGRRLYRTGDLVRYNLDGSITYIGRKDHQVKLNGQRLELGEVECHLRNCLETQLAVTVELITPANSNTQLLAAFICLRNGIDIRNETSDITKKEVLSLFTDARSRVAQALPSYMVPTLFVPLESLPLSVSSKLDRQKLRLIASTLPARALSAFTVAQSSKRQPSSLVETKLQRIWSSVLTVETDEIGADDNFFALGGDSITAIRMVTSAHSEHLNINVSDIFRHPRPSDLAKVISNAALAEQILPSSTTSIDSKPIAEKDEILKTILESQFSINRNRI